MRTAARNGRVLPTHLRRHLLLGTSGLAVLQLVHLLDALRYSDDESVPGLLTSPAAVIGIGTVTVAFVLLLRSRPSARRWTIVAGGLIALGFVENHVVPAHLGGSNPYFTFEDGNRADWFRWLTVLALIALGSWTAWTAWRAGRTSPAHATAST